MYQSLHLVHGENLKRMVLVEDAFMLLSQCKMMMEDVFILDGRMIVQSRVTKVNGIGLEHLLSDLLLSVLQSMVSVTPAVHKDTFYLSHYGMKR